MSEREIELRTVLERLEILEKQNRRIRRMGLAVLLFAGAGLLMAQVAAPPRVAEADLFVVRDKDGRKRATFGRDPERGIEVGMFFYNRTGEQCVALVVPETGRSASLSLQGEEGKALALSGGWPEVALLGKNGHSRAAFRLDWADQSYLALYDNSDRARAMLTVRGSGMPHLEIMDENQRTRAALGAYDVLSPPWDRVQPRPVSSLVLFDAAGKVIWSAPESGGESKP